jgi:AraC family transcriptional regulator
VAAFELLRLARAATLLVRSNLSVAAVAHACGFANPYHFSRRFTAATASRPDATATTRNAGNRPGRSHRHGSSPSATTSGGRPDNHSSRSG